MRLDDRERVEVTTRAQWRAWLAQHHGTSPGVWLVTYKKHRADRHLPYEELVEEALCFGWIDSTRRTLDADRSMLMVCPRRPGSTWSGSNKRRLQRLVAAGAMRPAGLGKVAAAQRDGSWTLLDDVEALIEPPDLAAALDASPAARRGYDGFSPSARRGLLWWIKTAKRAATREKRLALTVAGAAEGRVANQPG